jgi:hypothetical protein
MTIIINKKKELLKKINKNSTLTSLNNALKKENIQEDMRESVKESIQKTRKSSLKEILSFDIKYFGFIFFVILIIYVSGVKSFSLNVEEKVISKDKIIILKDHQLSNNYISFQEKQYKKDIELRKILKDKEEETKKLIEELKIKEKKIYKEHLSVQQKRYKEIIKNSFTKRDKILETMNNKLNKIKRMRNEQN